MPSDKNGMSSEKQGSPGPKRQTMVIVAVVAGLVALVFWLAGTVEQTPPAGEGVTLTYTAFRAVLDDGGIATAKVADDGRVSGVRKNGKKYGTRVPEPALDRAFLDLLVRKGVDVESAETRNSTGMLLIGLLPWVLIVGVLIWSARTAMGKGTSGARSFGAAQAKVADLSHPTTTFADIAGYEGVKAEILEVVDYLRRPERYHQAGAVGPGGVLMIGPPGTGKTLFARAIAGEAGVPFFSVTASSFVEMFVGVGASRVRDLFRQARDRAPSIIFIDEIDAIGQERSGRTALANDEREQTLNQLLAEMDGFDKATGVVVLAATNRPDILDPALLRPGRFDRRVVIPLPNQAERRAILEVHCRKKQLGPDVDLDVVARGTPGFSGADLANLANEAAIVAVRDERVVLAASDFDAARDRIVLGRRDKGNVLLTDERRLVAVHEAGHALVAACSPHADPVQKVSILPTGNALGVTYQLPVDERHVYTESYLDDALAVRVAGRAAERMVYGEGSSGAADDLANATELATRMVKEFGLSEEMGPFSLGPDRDGGRSLVLGPFGRVVSDETQRVIDAAISARLRRAEERATEILREHRRQLDALVARLIDKEVLDGRELAELLAGMPHLPTASGAGPRSEPTCDHEGDLAPLGVAVRHRR